MKFPSNLNCDWKIVSEMGPWLQWIEQRQLSDETINIEVLQFGAAYIRDLTVYVTASKISQETDAE